MNNHGALKGFENKNFKQQKEHILLAQLKTKLCDLNLWQQSALLQDGRHTPST
jgi:hypothetical protein